MIARMSNKCKVSVLEELQYSLQRKIVPTSNCCPLFGNLSFACPAGLIFLHRLIDLSMTVKHLHRFIQISREAQLDIFNPPSRMSRLSSSHTSYMHTIHHNSLAKETSIDVSSSKKPGTV